MPFRYFKFCNTGSLNSDPTASVHADDNSNIHLLSVTVNKYRNLRV